MDKTKKILLYAAAAIIILAALGLIFKPHSSKSEDTPAKYVFVMIGDGMGATQVAAVESYLSYKAGKLGGEQLTFTKFPILGLCTTFSANRNITDSSAAGTAIATGSKTDNGKLGVDPEGNDLKSMAYTFKEQGYRIGIMSSVPANHATPASFYGHDMDRGDYYNISLQIPESNFDFIAGSGLLEFKGENDAQEPIDKVLEREGYDVCFGLEELAASTDKTGVVVVQPSQKNAEALNYEINRDTEFKEDRLGEVLAAAIDYLGDENPFFIMCEGGEIDWAAHDNNMMSMTDAITRFDEAVKVAYDFYLEHPDETLIIVTADHETGGITLGSGHSSMIDWAGIEEAYAEGGKTSREENREISTEHNIGWASYGHTGGPVPIYAIGKGAEKFSGRMDNTDIYAKVVCE